MAHKHPLGTALNDIMIKEVPSYANKFFYSLGFLSMIAFIVLIISGTIMTFFGPTWWITTYPGAFTRSIHLWATQAFVLFILLHLLVVFFTSGFKKPRRLTWAIGVLMLFIVLAETEFGYTLRGDFSSQWRGLQGADFYNGSGLGSIINSLNYNQIYGIHIVAIPLVIISLLALHYLLVRVLGIAKPYRKDVTYETVPANHNVLFVRGGVLIALILALALLLPSPYIKPVTIQSIAKQDPVLISKTLLAEFNNTSDTATYLDNIDPYTYNTRDIYISAPYKQYLQAQAYRQTDALAVFYKQSPALQTKQLSDADKFLNQKTQVDLKNAPINPVMTVISSLTTMAQAGLYEPALLNAKNGPAIATNDTTYANRFLSDTGALEDKAKALNITTEQYGMVREATGHTPGAWWLSPIGLLNHTILTGDNNGDRDGAIIFGSLLLTMLAFPFIPYLNQLPDKLKAYKLIWRG